MYVVLLCIKLFKIHHVFEIPSVLLHISVIVSLSLPSCVSLHEYTTLFHVSLFLLAMGNLIPTIINIFTYLMSTHICNQTLITVFPSPMWMSCSSCSGSDSPCQATLLWGCPPYPAQALTSCSSPPPCVHASNGLLTLHARLLPQHPSCSGPLPA